MSKKTVKTKSEVKPMMTSLPPESEFPAEIFYSQQVMEHFLHPHHAGVLTRYDAVGEVGNIVCGDVMRIYIKVEPDMRAQPCIADISFETYGCGAAIATSSITCDLAMGKTLAEAQKLTKDQVVTALERLPAQKIHCSILAIDALHEAIYQYYTSQKMPVPASLRQQHDEIQQQKDFLKKQYESWMK